jgi:hypothetical protein
MNEPSWELQEIECLGGLEPEIETWLKSFPTVFTELETSRKKGDVHGHRKLVTRIVAGHKRATTNVEVVGSAVGRPFRIVGRKAKGADEISIAELERAMNDKDPEAAKAAIVALMGVKRSFSGGRLIEVTDTCK